MATVRDFENGEGGFARVSAGMFAAMLARVADMSLILDEKGIVRDASFGDGDLAEAGLGGLLGRPLRDAVTGESHPKIDALLSGASPTGRWRQVNLPLPGDDDVPLGLQAFGLGGGRTLVIARDERRNAAIQRRFVAAMRDAEREQATRRDAEARLHTLIALSGALVLTLDAATLAIVDASVEAAALVGGGPGTPLTALLHPDDGAALRDLLARAGGSGRVVEITARLRDGRPLALQAAAIREGDALRYILRVDDGERTAAPEVALVAALPHAVVVTDDALTIESVNRAFVDEVHLSLAENAVGQPLERFVGRGGVDTGIVAAALRDMPLVRGFATVLTPLYGPARAVELDAMRLPDGRLGFLLRARSADGRERPGDRAGLTERMTGVVGRVALKEIVRETTDAIERRCIETALELTNDNRAAAAEMLGISRQSLYAKLARFEMGERPDGDA